MIVHDRWRKISTTSGKAVGKILKVILRILFIPSIIPSQAVNP